MQDRRSICDKLIVVGRIDFEHVVTDLNFDLRHFVRLSKIMVELTQFNRFKAMAQRPNGFYLVADLVVEDIINKRSDSQTIQILESCFYSISTKSNGLRFEFDMIGNREEATRSLADVLLRQIDKYPLVIRSTYNEVLPKRVNFPGYLLKAHIILFDNVSDIWLNTFFKNHPDLWSALVLAAQGELLFIPKVRRNILLYR